MPHYSKYAEKVANRDPLEKPKPFVPGPAPLKRSSPEFQEIIRKSKQEVRRQYRIFCESWDTYPIRLPRDPQEQ